MIARAFAGSRDASASLVARQYPSYAATTSARGDGRTALVPASRTCAGFPGRLTSAALVPHPATAASTAVTTALSPAAEPTVMPASGRRPRSRSGPRRHLPPGSARPLFFKDLGTAE